MSPPPEVLATAAGLLLLAAAAVFLFKRQGGRKAYEASRAKGRASILSVLETLSDALIFQNVSIDFNGRLGDIDVLVIRDNGIFAIEAENAAGTLTVSNAPDWPVQTPRSLTRRTVRNPIARIMRNIRTLKERLESQSFPIRPQIEVVVCLTHEEGRTEVTVPQRAPILTLPELAPYLLGRPEMTPRNAHEAAKLKVFLLDNGAQCTQTGGNVCEGLETA